MHRYNKNPRSVKNYLHLVMIVIKTKYNVIYILYLYLHLVMIIKKYSETNNTVIEKFVCK